jgi:tetratricopeptide (TPR) repeat protein
MVAAALATALVATTAAALHRQSSPRRTAARPIETRTRTVTDRGIAALQERLRSVPGDRRAWAALGSAYVEQARITGDPTFYPKAEQSLRRSLAIEGTRNAEAMAGMGMLAAARHDFKAALSWGERARAINPHNAAIHGVIGDALVELGRYPMAFDAFQRMQALRPGLSSYARASYAWELQGNLPNAERSLELALESASGPADAAFASYYLGELAWNSGRVGDAARWYRQSAARDASFVPAIQGLAKVDVARGNIAAAIQRYETIVATVPLPQYVIELADLYEASGDRTLARQQVELLRVQARILRANGVNIDLEQALFNADHHVDVAGGLAAARAEWKKRRSVFVADALAWSLYANGRHHEALTYARSALRLGTRNALFFFHKGMIERALGMSDAARRDLGEAMAINPHFSFLWAPRVRRILEELR